jgi:hypothetical protein
MHSDLVSTYRKLPPLIVTAQELRDILSPLTNGYKWGENTIMDLWKLGAPMPNDNTRRIVFPNKLAEWLEDVLARQGRPLDEAAKAYNNLRKVSG